MRARLLVCVALLLLVGGCGSPAAPATSPGSPASSEASALAFRGTTVDGAAFDGATLAGTPVVLWFWAPY